MKKHIKGVGTVYPCKICGEYPVWGAVWGAFFLCCPNHVDHHCESCESDYNEPKGHAVRDWNKKNKSE